jgi:two-component system chemotaxis response regulator CheB
VQDPADALYPGMPESVLRYVRAHHVAPAAELGPLLGALAEEEIATTDIHGLSALEIAENDIAVGGARGISDELIRYGDMAGFACPDCDGPLIALNGSTRFRCQVGHAWTAEALIDAQGGRLERALWKAYRLLEEKATFAEGLAASTHGSAMGQRHRNAAREARESALVLRDLLLSGVSRDQTTAPDPERRVDSP